MKKLFLQTLSLLTAALSGFAGEYDWWEKAYVPAESPIPMKDRKLMNPEDVSIKVPGTGIVPIGKYLEKTSLAGEWKFSGIENSELPFPDACEEKEKAFADPAFDDSKWDTMKVPHNWWNGGKYDYKKVFRASDKTVHQVGNINKRTANPYCKGWYRHVIDIGEKTDGRIVLNFTVIGYSCELFVNGKFFASHHGDYSPLVADVTDFVKSGKNLIALRVLADLGPHDGLNTHVYGAFWTDQNVRGGLWNNVFLEKDRSRFRIEEMLLVPDHTGKLQAHYKVRNCTDKPVRLIPGFGVQFAEQGSAPQEAKEFPEITLKPGLNEGMVEIQEKDVKAWSPEEPHLYFCALYFREGKEIRSARVERFGFRDFGIKGSSFVLNGKPLFISMETAQAMSDSGDEGDPRERLEGFKVKGVNMLRTAHQPPVYQLMDAADEMGMMIWDEWAFCAINGHIKPEIFAKNDLEELAGFILRDHNHPSAVMWQLGNEVEHRTNKETWKTLNDQVALVRKLDKQKRPVCPFAANGNLHHYGYDKIDTDIIDYHLYTGITRPALRWDEDISNYINMTAKVYGKDGKIDMPITVSESIGGGWGHCPDASYVHGDVDKYVEILNRSYNWGLPFAQGYSGTIGVKALNDVNCQYKMIWNVNGTRIIEEVRQDPRFALFGTWIGAPCVNTPRWTQPVYPGIRVSKDKHIPLKQYFAPGVKKVNVFMANQGEKLLENAGLRIEIAKDGKVVPLTTLQFGRMAQGDRKDQDVSLTMPALDEGRWEIRLTVLDNGRENGCRNAYSVTLHKGENALAPVANAKKVLVIGNHKPTLQILKDLQVPYAVFNGKQKYSDYECFIIPPECSKDVQTAELMNRIETGGRILILEQSTGTVPMLKSYHYSHSNNTMAELVVEGHPVFKNLIQADFDIWGENDWGTVIFNVVTPLDATLLAAKGKFLDEKEAGNAVAEIKLGDGRVMLSQVQAVQLWKINPAATQYLRNQIAYLTAPEKLYDKVRTCTVKGKQNFSIADTRVFPIDLSKKCNNTLHDDKEGDGTGFTDQGPRSDLRKLTRGNVTAAGIPFTILKAGNGQKYDCITVGGNILKNQPHKVTGIPVGKKINAINFLHTAAYAGEIRLFADYIIHYKDGSSVKYPVFGGRNISDWWSPSSKPEGIACLQTQNDLGASAGVYAAQWINPYPEKEVVSFDLVDVNSAPVFLIAATAELIHKSPLPLYDDKKAQFWYTADYNGGKAEGKTMQENGKSFQRITMQPTSGSNGYSAIVIKLTGLDKNILNNNNYHYLSFWVRSNDTGFLDIMIPQVDFGACRIASIDIQESHGKWKFVRLNIADDFVLEGPDFDIQSMRNEIMLYNGRNKRAGWPRDKKTFDFRDMRLE